MTVVNGRVAPVVFVESVCSHLAGIIAVTHLPQVHSPVCFRIKPDYRSVTVAVTVARSAAAVFNDGQSAFLEFDSVIGRFYKLAFAHGYDKLVILFSDVLNDGMLGNNQVMPVNQRTVSYFAPVVVVFLAVVYPFVGCGQYLDVARLNCEFSENICNIVIVGHVVVLRVFNAIHFRKVDSAALRNVGYRNFEVF